MYTLKVYIKKFNKFLTYLKPYMSEKEPLGDTKELSKILRHLEDHLVRT